MRADGQVQQSVMVSSWRMQVMSIEMSTRRRAKQFIHGGVVITVFSVARPLDG